METISSPSATHTIQERFKVSSLIKKEQDKLKSKTASESNYVPLKTQSNKRLLHSHLQPSNTNDELIHDDVNLREEAVKATLASQHGRTAGDNRLLEELKSHSTAVALLWLALW